MLLDARRELGMLPAPPRRDVDATIGRLIQLDQAWGKRDKAAVGQALLVPASPG